MGLKDQMNRNQLIDHFVTTWHLSVPDRDVVGMIHANEILEAVGEKVLREQKYPTNLAPESDFDRTLIYQSGTTYIVLTKSEASYGQFVEIERKHFTDLEKAVAVAVFKIFRSELDGVKIQW